MKQLSRIGAILSVVLSSVLMTGCETVPITGRSQLNLVPESMVRSMAVQEYNAFLQSPETKLSTDSHKSAMVQRAGSRIADAVERYMRANGMEDEIEGYSWEFNLVDSEEVNAWAMPGGKVVVYTGLLDLAVMVVLGLLRVTGSLLIGIFFATVVGALFGHVARPASWVSLDWSVSKLAFHLDILGAMKISLWGSIFTLMFIDLFDSIGTLVACCEKAQMRDERGQIRGLDRLLGIDALATMAGALLGTSTTTSYVESAAGIEQGGRTGLTSVVTGVLFLLALLFIPVIAVVPGYATAPALIVVGYFMMKEARRINFRRLDELIPSLIIVVMIAVSYQISMGLALGFVSFVIVKTLLGRYKDIHAAMWLIAGLSLIFLIIRWWPS